MGLKGSGTMFKKLIALTIALLIITASSMSVFAGNPEGGGNTPSRPSTGSALTSPGALSKNSTTTESAISEELKSNKLLRAAFDAALENALRSGKAEDNGELILHITRPENNRESTYKKTYVLSGQSLNDYSDLVVSIARYNDKTGEYEPMVNTDGESSWNCYSAFSKEISLSQGANKIKILAYRKSKMEESKIQVNCFTIEQLNESIADKVVRKTNEISSNVGEDINKISRQVTNLIDLLSGKAK